MAYSIPELKWMTMTALINEIKKPQSFLTRLLFGPRTVELLDTETIEIDSLTGGGTAAPFIKKNGEALMVEGLGETFSTIEAPNIRIKRPFKPSDLLFNRQAGTVIFPGQSPMSAIQAKLSRELGQMKDDIQNSLEWMVALAMRGVITYSVEDEEYFTLTFDKPAGNTFTESPLWSTTSYPEETFRTVKRLINSAVGLVPTDCIMSQTAASAFMKNARVLTLLDNRRAKAGSVDYTRDYSEQGAIYLGNFCGIDCWEYARTISLNGTDTALVRAGYAEFVCATPAADNKLYYAAIPDMKALQGRKVKQKIFSKSWMEEDPSVYWALAHSRPLPVPRRPGSYVSVAVV
jgi:hypothetical protein